MIKETVMINKPEFDLRGSKEWRYSKEGNRILMGWIFSEELAISGLCTIEGQTETIEYETRRGKAEVEALRRNLPDTVDREPVDFSALFGQAETETGSAR